ncbi:MAG: helix-turn-helix domain-containing protein [Candidatus Poribacteria bacterium]|nr:helix-turn-helix domain-containing protein [Candidatus Poribacteria bacterium]
MPNENQALVYFFAKSNFGDNQPDFIKIGRTITDLSKRQTTLQTGNEAKIWEIGVIPFDSADEASREEKRIQSQFGAFRAEGEWFIATPRILKFIKNYAVQHTDLFAEEDPPETEDLTETEDPPEMSFGRQLANARESAGMTQEDLASRVGCTRGHIALIEQNRGFPGKSLYKKLVELFGIEFLESPRETIYRNSLTVEMDDRLISENTGIDTFIKVIEEIGIERIKELNKKEAKIPLVADDEVPDKAQRKVETDTGIYYIFSGLAITRMKRILDDIVDRLNLDMKVFINQVKKR